MRGPWWCAVLLLSLVHVELSVGWEAYELDLFDLVEEIGLSTSFYEFIGVEKTAETSEIKKAYRKLSLIWHPDKSDEPDAEQKFRRLVGVYEMLKDEQRRARYDRILVEGLPRWNQPMFYFRRAKKMRFWEITTILSVIFTIGHYLVLWASYFESTLAMNERLDDVRKRLEKKMKKSSKAKDVDHTAVDEEMARIMPVLKRPQLTDILPIKLAFFLIHHQFLIPHMKQLLTAITRSRQQSSATRSVPSGDDAAAEDDEHRSASKKSPVFRMDDIVPEMATNQAPVVSYLNTESPSPETTSSSTASRKANRPWSDDEKQLLCKTIVRFPPGTPRRWEKVAEVLGRHVSQVTDMARQIQHTVGSSQHIAQDHHSSFASPGTTIDQNLITERQPCDSSAADWSQADQHLFECALKTVPKDAAGVDRWEQIAQCVPGKTRDDCLARYRLIVQRVKAKKML